MLESRLSLLPCAGTIALALLIACGGPMPADPEIPPGTGAIRLVWSWPLEGVSLADTIRAEILIDGTLPERVVLVSGEAIVADRARPPWRFRWLPPESSQGTLRLRAVAEPGTPAELSSLPIQLAWKPNAPPAVRLLGVGGATVVIRSAAESLRAAAEDPEEGRLEGPALAWTSDLQGRLGLGGAIPTTSLIPGLHRVRVRASDRWLRSVSAEIEVEVVDASEGETPEGLLEDMRHALAARESELYVASLAPTFRFVLCPAERQADPSLPAALSQPEEAAFARTVLEEGGSWRLLRAGWSVSSIQPADVGGWPGRKAELEGIALAVVSAAGETLRVAGGRARLYLGWSGSRGRWQVEQWRDLGSGTETSQGGLRLRVQGIGKAGSGG